MQFSCQKRKTKFFIRPVRYASSESHIHLYSLSTAFSNRCGVFGELNTLSVLERVSVDGWPKRIEMNAFSNENTLVWRGPFNDSRDPVKKFSD